MSFSFGFTKDDFSDFSDDDDDDELEESNTYIKSNQSFLNGSNSIIQPLNALDSLIITPENKPKLHNLDSILSTLQGIRISFDNYTTPQGNIIYRRELFDVKHQLMIEEEQEEEEEEEGNNIGVHKLLIDENQNNNDLQKNVYEGGFKSWECSYDTVDALNKLINGSDSDSDDNNNSLLLSKSILELGCGTALPSCFLLLKKFQSIKESNQLQSSSDSGLRLILSDFNYDVLRLVTVPNLLIHWASTISIEQLHELTSTTNDDDDDGGGGGDKIESRFVNDEILITTKLIDQFKNDLNNYNIELQFISGSWGNEFINLPAIKDKDTNGIDIDVIISSETIYSLDTLPIVAESIKTIFQQSSSKSIATSKNNNNNNNNKLAIIAAKNIYFGVGGSLIEFLNYFNQITKNDNDDDDNDDHQGQGFNVSVEEINDSQLKRSLVYIDYRGGYSS